MEEAFFTSINNMFQIRNEKQSIYTYVNPLNYYKDTWGVRVSK